MEREEEEEEGTGRRGGVAIPSKMKASREGEGEILAIREAITEREGGRRRRGEEGEREDEKEEEEEGERGEGYAI